MNRNIQGKIVLITGATDGIGLEAARVLAGAGAQLILAARNLKKGTRVVAELKLESGNDNIEFMQADMSSQRDVRKLAASFMAEYDHLDILLNNAGAAFEQRQLSADGLEMTFALNHLGYFLLTNLLLDPLKKAAPSRIINVSSSAHWQGKVDLSDLNSERRYKSFQVYSTSKLENLLFTRELARRLEGTGVTVNAAHPGLVNSNFGKQGMGTGTAVFNLLQRVIGKTPAEGAKTLTYLALSDEVEGKTGGYYANEKPAGSSRASKDMELARKLWDESAEIVKL